MKYARILLGMAVVVLLACNQKAQNRTGHISPSFYHWKTSFEPTISDREALKRNAVKDLYLRFFDVTWDEDFKKPVPAAQLRVADKTFFTETNISIIPTVFITNECIKFSTPEQCGILADRIHALINDIVAANQFTDIREIQIDCDWTASTREKYFALLTRLQQLDSGRSYSATIRLFQVKYRTEAGVPPVKRGLLMCYNMGNLKDPATINSILNIGDLQKYTGNLAAYPLPLDVAFPIFSWYVLFSAHQYSGLISASDTTGITGISNRSGNNRFEVLMDTVWRNSALKKGDILRFEDSEVQDILKAARLLQPLLPSQSRRLSLYHLDSILLNKYSSNELETIFRSLD